MSAGRRERAEFLVVLKRKRQSGEGRSRGDEEMDFTGKANAERKTAQTAERRRKEEI
jgi:hypothetical protein